MNKRKSTLAALALLFSAASANNTTAQGCSRFMSGSALISEREYATGELEFTLKPSLAPGIVTVVGLANDGTKGADPFIQLVVNADVYGLDTVGVVLGGVKGLGEMQATYNISNVTNGGLLNSTALDFKWVRSFNDSSNFIELYLSANGLWEKAFSTVDLDQATDGDGVSQFLSAFPVRFNVHAATWYNGSAAAQDYLGD